jgi:hypothetical protein
VVNAQLVLLTGSWLLGLLAIASAAVLVGGRMAEESRRVGLLKAVGGMPGYLGTPAAACQEDGENHRAEVQATCFRTAVLSRRAVEGAYGRRSRRCCRVVARIDRCWHPPELRLPRRSITGSTCQDDRSDGDTPDGSESLTCGHGSRTGHE